jgi:hypothetical protein
MENMRIETALVAESLSKHESPKDSIIICYNLLHTQRFRKVIIDYTSNKQVIRHFNILYYKLTLL